MTGRLITVDEAREIVLGRAVPLGAEEVPAAEALGRVLAADLTAAEPNPPFDNSAMDGFAVLAADTAAASPEAPVSLRIAAKSRAGAPTDRALKPGEAIAISTGAMMPAGADAVVPVEDTAPAGKGEIEIRGAVAPGRHRRRAGEDIEAGARVLSSGTRLGPAELGVVARTGHAAVCCALRPRLSLVITGDELRPPGEPLGPGEIRDANAATLRALATEAGALAGDAVTVGDDRDATRDAIAAGLAGDVLVTSGGVSVGEHDHVRPALEELGVGEVFWGVALRPGKPTWFGVAESGTLVFGLPGNPVSAMVTFTLFARPAIAALLGTGVEPTPRVTAALTEPVPQLPARLQAVRCSLALSDEGWEATPTGPQGSHVLTSMLGADCLAFVPAGEGELAEGERVPIEMLGR